MSLLIQLFLEFFKIGLFAVGGVSHHSVFTSAGGKNTPGLRWKR